MKHMHTQTALVAVSPLNCPHRTARPHLASETLTTLPSDSSKVAPRPCMFMAPPRLPCVLVLLGESGR